MTKSPYRLVSAWAPLTMSLVALVVVAVHLALVGPQREADEGAAAHVWQLLMAGQVPLIVFFMARWTPTYRLRGLRVVLAQALAALVAVAPVNLLGL